MATIDQEQLVQTFRKFDANGDGLITRNELSVVLRRLDPKRWDDASIDKLLTAADTSGDGSLSYEEFVKWITSDEKKTNKTVVKKKGGMMSRMFSRSSASIESEPDEEQKHELELLAATKGALHEGAWEEAMDGTSKAAADVLATLPIPQGCDAQDVAAVDLFLHHFDPNPDTAEAVVGADKARALRWLHAALLLIETGEKAYRDPVRWLIANCRLWDPGCEDPNDPHFKTLKRLAMQQMQVHGGPLEDAYEDAMSHGPMCQMSKLGRTSWSTHCRQDVALKLPGSMVDLPGFDNLCDGLSYITLLLTAAHALNATFQLDAQRLCEKVGGEFRSAPPKCLMRMVERLYMDHADQPSPGSAENVDVLRNSWAFRSPEELLEAYDYVGRVFGQPLKVKNTFDDNFNAMKRTGGFRSITAYYQYSKTRTLWGPVCRQNTTSEAWAELKAMAEAHLARLRTHDNEHEHHSADSFVEVVHALDLAMEHMMSKEMHRAPASLIVEVQFHLKPYIDMRKRTVFWSKIARSPVAEVMSRDFCS